MNFRKDSLTQHGFTAAVVICKEIKFLPKKNKAILVMEGYKDDVDYTAGKKPCLVFEVEVNSAAYNAFVASSDIYNKVTNYLTGNGRIMDGAQVIVVEEPSNEEPVI